MTKESLNKSKNDLLLKAISKYDLTGREEEIILLIAKGLRQKEIADQLFISEATVKKHLSNIYVKLNVFNFYFYDCTHFVYLLIPIP
jgi:DNA-binding NarL/FixJ family response regulator